MHHPSNDRRLALVRDAACLAHTISGVALRIPLTNGQHLFVSHSCLGADLDPCQLRSALIVDRTHGLALLDDTVIGAEIVSGLEHLGGGLFQRAAADTNERWFTSTLDPVALVATLDGCPADPASFEVVVSPDSELGVAAVCVRCLDDAAAHLDEVAFGALATCLVAELLTAVDHQPHH